MDIQPYINWIEQHPHWTQAGVFLVALGESLAVVGLVVPGVAIMIAAGALIALGALEFWPTMLVAVAGAIAGDGISYWLGHRFSDRLRRIWPFRNHDEWINRGELFFKRHGNMSVLFGRFVGPVRPVIPIVAGMLGMRPLPFYGVNILSAFAWAPSYLLPGMVFGASLTLAGAIAARLALLLFFLVLSTWVLTWLVRWIFQVLSPQTTKVAQKLLLRINSHPQLSRLFGGVLDPERQEYKSLLLTGALLIGSAWLFLGILEDVITGDPLVKVDQGLYQLFQGLRTPWGDKLMVFLTELGDSTVISLVSITTLIWLIWRRSWRTAGYWAAAVAFGQAVATSIKLLLQRPRPVADLYNGLSTYSFPSGHSTMSMVVYGFLAALIAGQFPRSRRWTVFAVTALLICSIATSRLYLGAHWLSDVLGGLSLGFAWVCLLSIAYYRHPMSASPPSGLPFVIMLAFFLSAGWHISMQYHRDLQRYAPQPVLQYFTTEAWWQSDWRLLQVYREDLEGEFEEPLNVQWEGTLTDLKHLLEANDWRTPVSLSPSTALKWLDPGEKLEDLPLLPQDQDGRHEVLQMIYPLPTAQQSTKVIVLRMWDSGVRLDHDRNPLWIGSISFEKPRHIVLLQVPENSQQYDQAMSILVSSLDTIGLKTTLKVRSGIKIKPGWGGEVLLVIQD